MTPLLIRPERNRQRPLDSRVCSCDLESIYFYSVRSPINFKTTVTWLKNCSVECLTSSHVSTKGRLVQQNSKSRGGATQRDGSFLVPKWMTGQLFLVSQCPGKECLASGSGTFSRKYTIYWGSQWSSFTMQSIHQKGDSLPTYSRGDCDK